MKMKYINLFILFNACGIRKNYRELYFVGNRRMKIIYLSFVKLLKRKVWYSTGFGIINLVTLLAILLIMS